ncbi:MAG: hypothetical protein ACYSWP_25920 [Planctomycetota bacterium]|jgi:hypothetical protein
MVPQVAKVVLYNKIQRDGLLCSDVTWGRLGILWNAFDDMTHMIVVCRPKCDQGRPRRFIIPLDSNPFIWINSFGTIEVQPLK